MIGAGKMSRLLLKHMAAKGCKSLVMLNRRCVSLVIQMQQRIFAAFMSITSLTLLALLPWPGLLLDGLLVMGRHDT